MNCFL
jgi:hypothetical protein